MQDYMVQAISADGSVRAYAATTRDLVETARSRHNTSPVATAALGRLLTAAAMMGSMMKGEDDLLTLKIEGDGPIRGLTATADAFGHVKGYVEEPNVLLHANAQGKLDVGGAVGKGILYVMRDIGMKEPYVGEVDLISGEIAEDLTYYYATSEQTPSSVGLGVLMNRENTVRQAGGFIIQLMPDAKEETIDQLEKNLAEITSVTEMLEQNMSPEDILTKIFGNIDLEILDFKELSFYCSCSRERTRKVLESLSFKELSQMIREGENTTLHCSFCNTDYVFTPDELQEILMDKYNHLQQN